jgi:hypothetical protein
VRVVLHIGTDKTGSTSIQNTVFLNRKWLLAHSIYVPETGLGEGNGHAGLLRQMEDGALAQLAAELLAASEAGYAQALLSWEGMSSLWFGRKHIRRLMSALGGFQVHVLVYLREQAEVIQSGHLQRVKRNMNLIDIAAIEHPRTLRERFRALAALRNPNRNYYRLLRPWQRCIPGATFSVRIYSRAQLHGGDVVSDFLDQLKVCRDERFTGAKEYYNPSLDVEGALLLESMKKSPAWKDRIIALVDVTQSLIGVEGQATRYFLSENTVASIRRHYPPFELQACPAFHGQRRLSLRGVESVLAQRKPGSDQRQGTAAPAESRAADAHAHADGRRERQRPGNDGRSCHRLEHCPGLGRLEYRQRIEYSISPVSPLVDPGGRRRAPGHRRAVLRDQYPDKCENKCCRYRRAGPYCRQL